MDTTIRRHPTGCWKTLGGWLIAASLGCMVVCGGRSAGQTGTDSEFHPYVLQHAAAADVEAALAKLLPPPAEVLPDPTHHRILVRGGSAAHQLVQQTLQTLDRPASPAASPMAQPSRSEPILKSYSVPAGEVMPIAQKLRGEFQGSDVRIAADQRTGQILVLAPFDVQTQIRQRLGGESASTAAAAPNRPLPVPVVRSQTSIAQPIELRYASLPQMAGSLQATLDKRLQPVTAANSGAKHYRIQLTGDTAADLIFDSQSGRIVVQGPPAAVDACTRLVQALDGALAGGDQRTQLLPIKTTKPADLQRAVEALQAGRIGRDAPGAASSEAARRAGGMLAMMIHKTEGETGGAAPAKPDDAATPRTMGKIRTVAQEGPAPETGEAPPAKPDNSALVGPVQIEILEGLDVLVVRGNQRDVEQVMQIIQQIEKLSVQTEPSIEVYPLQHVDGESLAFLVNQLYADVYLQRQGSVSITALVKPNALLLVGRAENVKTAIDLIKRLDQPVAPETEFQIFALKNAPSASAAVTVQNFLLNRGGLGTKARVTADMRSNTLIVQAAPRDLAEVAELVKKIDTSTSEAVNEVKVIPLENSLAAELAMILQFAISGQSLQGRGMTGGMGTGATGALGGVGTTGVPGATTGAAGLGTAANRMGLEQKTSMLRFTTIDAKGRRVLNSGILTDVHITPDTRANSLIVSAPADSMELIEALIKELDGRPAAQAAIKVFTIVNGDVMSLQQTLNYLFGMPTTGFGNAATPQTMLMQTAAGGEGESSLVPLRFAVDTRTNSIIASGSLSDLAIVEAIILRLDEADIRKRKTTVYRLKNSPALDVANSVNQFLTTEYQIQQRAPQFTSAFEQMEQEVVVVAEPVSNSLIVSASPRFYDEIKTLVEQLDKRPSMVVIQVLLGQVTLNNTNEFGIELGLQDSVLFDRSIISNLITTSTQTSNQNGITTTTNVLGSTLTPGYGFNNQNVGNNGNASNVVINGQNTIVRSPGDSSAGGQSLTNFGVGRTNGQLGYGGLVLSASSESISVLIRALQQCQRLEVLSRPQIMTLDNQPAFVQVGERVPRITSVNMTATGQINATTLDNVGLMLRVVPRISPDGLVVMEIDAENSSVGSDADGIPISINTVGQVIRSPRIETTLAQTTVSAVSGQSVVLGGLISKSTSAISRRVPYLADIPILGNLFKYDSKVIAKTELLIVMTPHIIANEEDAQKIKQVEAARMSWCMADVVKIHGDNSLRTRTDEWSNSETTTVYPDVQPGVSPTVAPALSPEPVPMPKPSTGQPTPAGARPQGVRVEESVPSLEQAPVPSQPTSPNRARFHITPTDNARQAPPPQQSVTPAAYQGDDARISAWPRSEPTAGSVVPAYGASSTPEVNRVIPATTPVPPVYGPPPPSYVPRSSLGGN